MYRGGNQLKFECFFLSQLSITASCCKLLDFLLPLLLSLLSCIHIHTPTHTYGYYGERLQALEIKSLLLPFPSLLLPLPSLLCGENIGYVYTRTYTIIQAHTNKLVDIVMKSEEQALGLLLPLLPSPCDVGGCDVDFCDSCHIYNSYTYI